MIYELPTTVQEDAPTCCPVCNQPADEVHGFALNSHSFSCDVHGEFWLLLLPDRSHVLTQSEARYQRNNREWAAIMLARRAEAGEFDDDIPF